MDEIGKKRWGKTRGKRRGERWRKRRDKPTISELSWYCSNVNRRIGYVISYFVVILCCCKCKSSSCASCAVDATVAAGVAIASRVVCDCDCFCVANRKVLRLVEESLCQPTGTLPLLSSPLLLLLPLLLLVLLLLLLVVVIVTLSPCTPLNFSPALAFVPCVLALVPNPSDSTAGSPPPSKSSNNHITSNCRISACQYSTEHITQIMPK